MRMKAMVDLQTNMENLEKIIVQKDFVIYGMRRTLDKAFGLLESGAAEKLRKEHDSLLTTEQEMSVREDRERFYLALQMELEKQVKENASLQKAVKSYESAVEKLTEKFKEEKNAQKAKEDIVEQYLQQAKKDHQIEIENMQECIRTLREQLGQVGRNGGRLSQVVNMMPTALHTSVSDTTMDAVTEKLKKEVAELQLKLKIELNEKKSQKLQADTLVKQYDSNRQLEMDKLI